MRTRKIIISNYDDIKNPFYGGGGAMAIHEIAKRLVREYQVVVVTGKYPGSRDEIVDGVIYQRIGTESKNGKYGQIVFYFSLFRYFLDQKFDLWIENFTPPFSTNFLQLLTKKPVVALVHMFVGQDMKRKYKLPFNLVENLGVKTYKYFITPTHIGKMRILNINSNAQVSIIPNGTDIKPNIRVLKKKFIIFLGRIEINQKGLDLLVEAFDSVKEELACNLVIAGSGSIKEIRKLKKIIRDKGLSNRITLAGKIIGKNKNKMLNQALMVVIPSRLETFSVVALESLAMGLPVVSFNIDGLKWIPKSASLKIMPFNHKIFGRAMLTLSQSKRMRKMMGHAGQDFARSMTWENIFAEYKDYLKQIVN